MKYEATSISLPQLPQVETPSLLLGAGARPPRALLSVHPREKGQGWLQGRGGPVRKILNAILAQLLSLSLCVCGHFCAPGARG